AEQGTAVDLKPHHRELAVLEAEPGITGCRETEERVGPVLHGKNLLSIEATHVLCFASRRPHETNPPGGARQAKRPGGARPWPSGLVTWCTAKVHASAYCE